MHGRPGGPPTRGTGPEPVVRGDSRRLESNAVGRHLRLMGRSPPSTGQPHRRAATRTRCPCGFLTNVSRASNPAGPIAADAGMLAVQTRHLRRRPGSCPRPQRHPLTLAVRRLPAGTGVDGLVSAKSVPQPRSIPADMFKARTLPSSITWSSGGSRRATAAGKHGGVGGSAGELACWLAPLPASAGRTSRRRRAGRRPRGRR